MPNPLSISIQRSLVADLHRLSAERAAAEKRVEQEFVARNKAAQKEYATSKDQTSKAFKSELDSTQHEFNQALARPDNEYKTQHDLIEAELTETRERVLERFHAREQEAVKQLEQDSWQATTVFEASHPGLLEQFNRVEARVNGSGEVLKAVAEQAWQHLELCRQTAAWDALPIDEPAVDGEDPFKQLADCTAAAQERLAELRGLAAPKFFIGV